MIRNGSKNRKHRDKPYQRVHVPPDIINQLDTLGSPASNWTLISCSLTSVSSKVGETSPSRASGSSGAANVSRNPSWDTKKSDKTKSRNPHSEKVEQQESSYVSYDLSP